LKELRDKQKKNQPLQPAEEPREQAALRAARQCPLLGKLGTRQGICFALGSGIYSYKSSDHDRQGSIMSERRLLKFRRSCEPRQSSDGVRKVSLRTNPSSPHPPPVSLTCGLREHLKTPIQLDNSEVPANGNFSSEASSLTAKIYLARFSIERFWDPGYGATVRRPVAVPGLRSSVLASAVGSLCLFYPGCSWCYRQGDDRARSRPGIFQPDPDPRKFPLRGANRYRRISTDVRPCCS